MGGVIFIVSAEVVFVFVVVVIGLEGGLLVGGRDDSSFFEFVVEEIFGIKGNDGRNLDGMGRGVVSDMFRGGKEERGGKFRIKMV